MIARNEEAVLGKCLLSAKDIADEIIVVDTGSIDSSKQIALDAGAKVVDFPWCDDFSAARNAGLDVSTGQWILVLDADEYLPAKSSVAIRKIIEDQTTSNCAFQLLNKSTNDEGKTGLVGKIVRLFPNLPTVRYEWPVHEQVATSLLRAGMTIRDTSVEIFHTGYSSPTANIAKQARNLKILKSQIASGREVHAMTYFLMGGALLDLGRIEESLAAYQECKRQSECGSEVFEAARVRVATCHMKLKNYPAILELAPSPPSTEWHPELVVLLGEAAVAMKQETRALDLLYCALDARFRPLMPAYDLSTLKARAIIGIASLWNNREPSRAIALLKLGLEARKMQRELSSADAMAITEMP